MNGLEAIELMKQGKMIKSGIWIYSMDSDGGIWLKTELRTGWVGAHMFNILANDYEEYIEPKSLTGWHAKGKQMDFWMMHSDGDVEDEKYWHEDEYRDEDRFSTKEKAEEIAFKQTLFRKLQRFSDENGGNEIDWNDEIKMKWGIWYNPEYEELASCPYFYGQAFGQVYFISEEVAEKAIELFRDELIKYFTHDWSGKDETPINLNSEER